MSVGPVTVFVLQPSQVGQSPSQGNQTLSPEKEGLASVASLSPNAPVLPLSPPSHNRHVYEMLPAPHRGPQHVRICSPTTGQQPRATLLDCDAHLYMLTWGFPYHLPQGLDRTDQCVLT